MTSTTPATTTATTAKDPLAFLVALRRESGEQLDLWSLPPFEARRLSSDVKQTVERVLREKLGPGVKVFRVRLLRNQAKGAVAKIDGDAGQRNSRSQTFHLANQTVDGDWSSDGIVLDEPTDNNADNSCDLPQSFCPADVGRHVRLRCDGDSSPGGGGDHVCIMAGGRLSLARYPELCLQQVGKPWQLFTAEFCSRGFDDAVIPSRQHATAPADAPCPENYAAAGSCELCHKLAARRDRSAGAAAPSCPEIPNATNPLCAVDPINGNVTFYHDADAAQTLASGADQVCVGLQVGCTDDDVRRNADGVCDDTDDMMGLYIVAAGGGVLAAAFTTRHVIANTGSRRLPIVLEFATFVCTLDLLTDTTYIATQTFITEKLYYSAMFFLVFPVVMMAGRFFLTAYNLVSRSNALWRVTFGASVAVQLWAAAYGDFATRPKVLLAVLSATLYVACLSCPRPPL